MSRFREIDRPHGPTKNWGPSSVELARRAEELLAYPDWVCEARRRCAAESATVANVAAGQTEAPKPDIDLSELVGEYVIDLDGLVVNGVVRAEDLVALLTQSAQQQFNLPVSPTISPAFQATLL
jgi:hypothetical protein